MLKKKSSYLHFVTIKRLLVVYCVFVLVILASYGALSYHSVKQMESTVVDNTKSQLGYLSSRMDDAFEAVQFSVAGMLNNKDITNYEAGINTSADMRSLVVELQKNIGTSQVLGSITARFSKIDKSVSSSSLTSENETAMGDFFSTIRRPGWYRVGAVSLYYVNFAPFQTRATDTTDYDLAIAGKLKQDSIYELLANSAGDNRIHSLFQFEDGKTIALEKIPSAVNKKIKLVNENQDSAEYMVDSGFTRYFLYGKQNSRTGTWIYSYIDMGILSEKMLNTVLTSVGVLLLLVSLAFFILFVFYFKIFKNIKILVTYLKSAESGNYTERIPESQDEEFSFVFQRYNDMIEQTESLVEGLKKETNLRETAEFRQLQAQINPHFLYNNLLFIMSMADKSPKAVELMTSHLAEYYRYVTKKNVDEVTFAQEMKFAENYLTIMSLRKDIDFSVDFDEALANFPFMQLIIQPIVENAVYHGIEERIGSHEVVITTHMEERGFTVSVYNDGQSLDEDEINQLLVMINKDKPKKNGSVGLWNVQQRLLNRYGKKSTLKFSVADGASYGLTVSFWVPLLNWEEEK